MGTKEMNTNKEAARTILYQFLALAFYEPTKELLADFKESNNSEQLLAASDILLGSEGLELMEQILKTIEVATANTEELVDVKAEYTKLFLGPMTPPCPPYESVYDKERSQEDWGTMAGPSAEAMDNLLAQEGLAITLDFAELSDHIAIQLEYMYYLLSKAYFGQDNVDEYLEKAESFLKSHLAKWLPDFGVLVFNKSEHPFYRSVGMFLEKMIKADVNKAI